jgi:hypothetical protein
VEDAERAGQDTVDIEFPADETAVDITERITHLLDAADVFCRSGDLLTLAAPQQVVAWRHWWRDQVVSQICDNTDPVAWAPVTQP